MNLSVQQYKHMRLSGMKDTEILQAFNYAPTYKRKLQKWKKENGVQLGKGKTQLLDPKEVFEYLQTHSMLLTAEQFGVQVESLYKWVKEQRRKNIEY